MARQRVVVHHGWRYDGGRERSMVIRGLEHHDVEALADLAQSERLLHAGRRPRVWAPAVSGHHIHPLLLHRTIDAEGAVGLVDERGGAVVGAIVATPQPDSPRSWIVDDFVVRSSPEWDTSGRALLAALAARAVASGVVGITVTCATIDVAKARMLRASQLERRCWVRHCDLGHHTSATAPDARPFGDEDAAQDWEWLDTSLPPLTGGAPRTGWHERGWVVADNGVVGAAMVAGILGAPAGFHDDGTALVAAPFGFTGPRRGDAAIRAALIGRLLGALAVKGGERGHRHLLVVCSDRSAAVEAAAADSGYEDTWGWWHLDMRRRR